MTPASILPVMPGEHVLDLCAAPGGKATALGAKLAGEGLLVANDISASRAKALLKNLEIFGIRNSFVTNAYPAKLAEQFAGAFDKILVDAPCSGEGMFRKDLANARVWSLEKVKECAKTQHEIIRQAVSMLRPGGLLLYSTCTFSPEENEQTIASLLQEHPELQLVELPWYEGFAHGRPELADGNVELEKCIRIFPHRMGGEGHFLALFHKKENGMDSGAAVLQTAGTDKEAAKRKKEAQKQEDLIKFLESCKRDWDLSRIYIRDEQVYYLPEGLRTGLPLRFLRTGLHLGELKKGRFEPSQAFAMALKKEEYPVRFDLKTEDDRVIRYLKGETLSLVNGEEPIKGWCLVTVEGFPLGWAKGNGMTLKNKYYAGWRWQ